MAKRNTKLKIDPNLRKNQTIFLIISALISISLLIIPYADFIAKVFNIFTTIIHETGHAVANLLSGNTNISIKVDLLTQGGVTMSYGVRNIFTISAGYLGASLLGGLLLILSAFPKISDVILKVLGAFLLLIASMFMLGQWLTFAVTIIFASMFIVISFIKEFKIIFFFINFLAVQLIINSFSDIITLIKISTDTTNYKDVVTDAHNMAEITFGTSWFWALVYLLLSLFIFFFAFKINRQITMKGKRRK